MRNTLKILLIGGGLVAAASMALAEKANSPKAEHQMPGMMQNQGGMSGMMGMMQMMQQMGPMMEQCREMMATMTDHMKSAPRTPETQGNKG
jgi:hypothetical protein